MEIKKEKNRVALERISFHLNEAMRFCNQLNLSGLAALEQAIWNNRTKTCKDGIVSARESVQRLSRFLE